VVGARVAKSMPHDARLDSERIAMRQFNKMADRYVEENCIFACFVF